VTKIQDGSQHLAAALRSRIKRARTNDPEPYDQDWGWWMEKRLRQLEKGQNRLLALVGTTLVAEIIRIALIPFGP
jgi:hypothetical protein